VTRVIPACLVNSATDDISDVTDVTDERECMTTVADVSRADQENSKLAGKNLKKLFFTK